MPDPLDVYLRLILDYAAQQTTERGIDELRDGLEALDETQLDQVVGQFEEFFTAMEEANEQLAKTKREIAELNKIAMTITRGGQVLTGMGAAITGVFALNAKRYISFMEKAKIENDEVADRWVAATKRIDNAQLNIGATMATAVLPLLEKGAALIERVAMLVAQNPEAVKAIFGAGVGLTILGALAMAVAKGIRIWADYKFLAATAQFDRSVNKLLAGMSGRSLGAGPGGVGAGLGKAGQVVGTVTLLATSVIIGAEIGKALGNWLGRIIYGESYKKQGFADAALTWTRMGTVGPAALAAGLEKLNGPLGRFGDLLGDNITKVDQTIQGWLGLNNVLDENEQELRDFIKEAEEAAEKTRQLSMALQRTEMLINLEKGLQSIDQNLSREIAQVQTQASQAIVAARRNLQAALAGIDADLTSQLTSLASNFAMANAQAERDYQIQRQETIRQGQEQVEKIRIDHLERIRKIEMEHSEAVDNLTRARDALGLVKEQRRYEEQLAEEDRQFEKQTQEAKHQTQLQLQQQRRAFIEMQNQRRQEYLAQVEEARLMAEQRRKEAQLQFQEQLKEIDRESTERIAQLRRNAIEERRAMIENAKAALNDLDAVLRQERLMKHQYYQAMLDDAGQFLNAYFSALSQTMSGGSTGSGYYLMPGQQGTSLYQGRKQAGGYTRDGMYMMHDSEFVLSPSTTKAAEGLIGSRLTQQSLLGGLRSSVTWNDQRRFFAGVKPEERREITSDTFDVLAAALGG